jgi:F420H(2)-dependent quinone reductase
VADTFDKQVISEFRTRVGVVIGLQDLSLLLLHHFGATLGTERVTPLAFWSVSHNAVVVLASNRGAPRHPDWYYNLVAHPPRPRKSGQSRGRFGLGWRLPRNDTRSPTDW